MAVNKRSHDCVSFSMRVHFHANHPESNAIKFLDKFL